MPTTPSEALPIRVLLVDDHTLVRAGLRMLLETRDNVEVVGEAANSSAALDLAAREQPGVILLDLDLDGTSGLDLIAPLYEAANGARVILLTGMRDREQHSEAVRRGAMGVVLKEQASDVLLKAIDRVNAGEVWLDPSLVANVLTRISRAIPAARDPEEQKIASLTARECEVVALICEGLANKEVARRLSITETTVGHHLRSIFSKLGVASRLELVIYAYQHGLAKVPE